MYRRQSNARGPQCSPLANEIPLELLQDLYNRYRPKEMAEMLDPDMPGHLVDEQKRPYRTFVGKKYTEKGVRGAINHSNMKKQTPLDLIELVESLYSRYRNPKKMAPLLNTCRDPYGKIYKTAHGKPWDARRLGVFIRKEKIERDYDWELLNFIMDNNHLGYDEISKKLNATKDSYGNYFTTIHGKPWAASNVGSLIHSSEEIPEEYLQIILPDVWSYRRLHGEEDVFRRIYLEFCHLLDRDLGEMPDISKLDHLRKPLLIEGWWNEQLKEYFEKHPYEYHIPRQWRGCDIHGEHSSHNPVYGLMTEWLNREELITSHGNEWDIYLSSKVMTQKYGEEARRERTSERRLRKEMEEQERDDDRRYDPYHPDYREENNPERGDTMRPEDFIDIYIDQHIAQPGEDPNDLHARFMAVIDDDTFAEVVRFTMDPNNRPYVENRVLSDIIRGALKVTPLHGRTRNLPARRDNSTARDRGIAEVIRKELARYPTMTDEDLLEEINERGYIGGSEGGEYTLEDLQGLMYRTGIDRKKLPLSRKTPLWTIEAEVKSALQYESKREGGFLSPEGVVNHLNHKNITTPRGTRWNVAELKTYMEDREIFTPGEIPQEISETWGYESENLLEEYILEFSKKYVSPHTTDREVSDLLSYSSDEAYDEILLLVTCRMQWKRTEWEPVQQIPLWGEQREHRGIPPRLPLEASRSQYPCPPDDRKLIKLLKKEFSKLYKGQARVRKPSQSSI